MDYLDPKKKKLKSVRIMIGYVLMGIAISITTVVVVYLANGYYVDTETGEVIQNGLLYVDSKPESAEVYLNGEKQRGATDSRLVVPAGSYNIRLDRDGYRPWSREVKLEGGSLRRLTYARLVPNTLISENVLDLPSLPIMTTQSIDKRWMVMAFTDNPLNMKYVDINSSVLELQDIPLPLGLLDTRDAGSWKAISWADDNKTFLAKYVTEKTTEYVLIDRDDPTNSKKLKDVFSSIDFTEISLRNNKKDLLFTHDKVSGAIFRANVSSGVLEPYMNDVIDYVAFGNETVLYVTSIGAKDGYVKAVLKDGDEEYLIREIKKDSEYLLEMSKLGRKIIIGIGSAAENRVIVYDDPIKDIKDNELSSIPVPTTVLRVAGPTELSISSDSSVILARGKQSFASHEFEADRSYVFKVEEPIDTKHEMTWIDGQHFSFRSGGVRYMMDFDGSNQYELVKSVQSLGSYFDHDIDHLFTFSPAVKDTVPAKMVRTFMRTPEDR